MIRSASATNRLMTRSNSLLCAGPVAFFNSEAIASSFRCTSANSSLAMCGITMFDGLDCLILPLCVWLVAPTET